MARFDNIHSQLVAWLKVVLPLIALAILSTLFLVSQRTDPERAIPYSEVEVAAILREQRIDNPDYASVTDDGTAITIAATSARPETSERFSADDVRLRLETPDGGILDLTAGVGLIDTDQQRADLSQGVRMVTSTGYVMNAQGVSAALDATDVLSDGALTARGPMGTLEAGQMAMTQAETAADDPAYVLIFQRGVRLIYQPKPSQGGKQ